jgi:uncharacterized protein
MSIAFPSLQNAKHLLNETLSDASIQRHCEATRVKAVQIAALLSQKIQCNQQLVEIGALLHDIGRSQVHDVTHGYVGGQILQSRNYPRGIIKIVEKHVLGGFSEVEAEMIGLPKRDFIPQTWEEKIVCVADKLGVFFWDGIVQPQQWITKVNNRFVRLTKRYGRAEPFQTSMQRARHFTEELMGLALSK